MRVPSALKVALVSVTGEVVAAEEEAHGCELLPGGGAEQDADGWWALISRVSSRLMARGTVAPGDPPYRPRILFQVRREGLRTYYLAYPLLESLRLPMARENVSAKEAPSNRRTIFDP